MSCSQKWFDDNGYEKMIMLMKKKRANEVAIKVPPHGVNFGNFSAKVFSPE